MARKDALSRVRLYCGWKPQLRSAIRDPQSTIRDPQYAIHDPRSQVPAVLLGAVGGTPTLLEGRGGLLGQVAGEFGFDVFEEQALELAGLKTVGQRDFKLVRRVGLEF